VTDAHFAEHAELTALDHGGELPSTVDCLIATVEDAAVPLARRLAAGSSLGLVGDPRVGAEPVLVAVSGGDVEIGLAADRVTAVVDRWRHVGVEESWIRKEVPTFRVRLGDFRIARYPVTNAQYLDFLRATGTAGRPTTWYLGAYPWDRANHPVCGISAADADAYVQWLAGRTGRPYRLPTEAEWEHAAKGDAGHEYPWGDAFDPACANTRETGVHTTTPVGAFPAGRSPFGADDMAGNAEEYVADAYAPYPGGGVVADHLVERLGGYRIARGGSFARYGDLARTRRRHGAFPGPLYPIGLRVAMSGARTGDAGWALPAIVG
jgi:formylglycine-generating enzyme required for sulfatase activity